MRFSTPLTLAAAIFAASAFAQQQPIAYVPTEGVSVSGSLAVANGKASIGNDGTITAGDSTAHIQLARGGELRLCASTKVHLSKDSSVNAVDPAADSALMIALDRGAVEASYTPGKYSDVLLTPDLRILISGPGQADLKIRTNQKGDTCIDNHGANAPYITVTSQFEGGLYRVQPNQRVMFEHGSLSGLSEWQLLDRYASRRDEAAFELAHAPACAARHHDRDDRTDLDEGGKHRKQRGDE